MKVIKNNEIICKRLTLRNHLYALFPLVVFTLIISIGVYLFYQRYGVPANSMLTIMILLYSIFAAPAIFLHFEYIINDWGVSITIDNRNKKVIYRKSQLEIIFAFDEIEKVYFFGETKDFNNLTTQNHYFYFFKLKNNKPLIISCLVVRNIENIISKASVTKNRRFFPSILFEDGIKKKM